MLVSIKNMLYFLQHFCTDAQWAWRVIVAECRVSLASVLLNAWAGSCAQ